MAFLCPVRIRRGKKKKPLGGSGDHLDINKDSLSLAGHRTGVAGNGGTGGGLSGSGGVGGGSGGGGSSLGGGGGTLGSHGMGRITGSASIETLVRVGIEKEHGLSPDSKMVVLHDFTPCVDDELEVRRGQCVNILYRENDWVYVIGQDTRQEGFIPHSYCATVQQYNTQLADLAIKKKLPRGIGADLQSASAAAAATGGVVPATNGGTTDLAECMLMPAEISSDLLIADDGGSGCIAAMMGLHQASLKHSSQASLSSEPDFLPFSKDPSGRYIVLYTFIARDENDVSVERGEFVTVLNREDPEWFWIVRSDGQEGFIPSGFVYPADNVLHENAKAAAAATQHMPAMSAADQVADGNHLSIAINNSSGGCGTSQLGSPLLPVSQASQSHQQQPAVSAASQVLGGADDLRYHGTELVALYDYKAQAPDDLSVRRGDWIYADLNNQTVDGWLWAYAPKTRKYGFIPKAYARPPAMTSL